MSENIMMILGKEITYAEDAVDIHQLKFYDKNPRILSKLIHEKSFGNSNEDKQTIIERTMADESSVRNLLKTIKHHGGIMEPLIVQNSTLEVLEGNSRLAALRKLNRDDGHGAYATAQCRLIELNDNQIDAFLHQQHVEGKTPWTAFNQAHRAYLRVCEDKVDITHYARITSTSTTTIQRQIDTIALMKEQQMESQTDKFSYYDIIIRSTKLKPFFEQNPSLKKFVLESLKKDKPPFEAQGLRDDLPNIAKKPKVLNKLIDGSIDFTQALEDSRVSQPKQFITKARSALDNITKKDIEQLDDSDRTALKIEVKRCKKDIQRISDILG